MDNFIFQGILIGLLFGIPAGAVGAMAVQRTLNYGIKAGLVTGLGSSAADCLYACIGAFGLTLVSDFLMEFQSIIHLAGSCLILGMGIRLLQSKTFSLPKNAGTSRWIAMFFSAFAVGITNPAAILTFLFAFSWFGISSENSLCEGAGLILGVFAGTYLWWGLLSGVVTLLKKKVKKIHLRCMNRFFGVLLVLFGTVMLIKNFWN